MVIPLCKQNDRVMKRNLKSVIIKVDEAGLRLFKSTPTFSNLLHTSQLNSLRVGDNTFNINHVVFSKMVSLLNNNNHIYFEEITTTTNN